MRTSLQLWLSYVSCCKQSYSQRELQHNTSTLTRKSSTKYILAYVLNLILLHNLNLRPKQNYYRFSKLKNQKNSNLTFSNNIDYLLFANDPRTIKLSSIRLMISDVLSPRRSSLPRFWKQRRSVHEYAILSWIFHSILECHFPLLQQFKYPEKKE